MPAMTIRDVDVEGKPGHLVAVFTLSAIPDRAWVGFFRSRARYSVFNASATAFVRDQARIQLSSRDDLEPLKRSFERFIEGANLDVELNGGS
jgi:hypothetical protein